jgi:hypothetical protein
VPQHQAGEDCGRFRQKLWPADDDAAGSNVSPSQGTPPLPYPPLPSPGDTILPRLLFRGFSDPPLWGSCPGRFPGSTASPRPQSNPLPVVMCTMYRVPASRSSSSFSGLVWAWRLELITDLRAPPWHRPNRLASSHPCPWHLVIKQPSRPDSTPLFPSRLNQQFNSGHDDGLTDISLQLCSRS